LPAIAIGLLLSARGRANRRVPRIGWRGWMGVHVGAFFLAVDLVVWNWSLKLIGVCLATLLGNTAPIWVAVAGFVFFKERFAPRFLLGLGVALAGVVLLVLGGSRSHAGNDWLGLMLATSGAIGYAGYLRAVKAARSSVGLTPGDVLDQHLHRLVVAARRLAAGGQCHAAHAAWLARRRRSRHCQPDHRQGLISWALGHCRRLFPRSACS
jgi:multidrug transporter EmrE-like cation transporter